jgi:hypothetical protein
MIRKHYSLKYWSAVSNVENFGNLRRFHVVIPESRISFRSIAQHAKWGSFIFNDIVIGDARPDPSYPRIEDNL